jgi:Fe-S cluster biogenesis protein NfuA
MRDKVEAVLDEIRPNLMADGGNVQLIDVKDGVVTVRLLGACGGCPMATMTLRQGIERTLKEQVPEVKKVVGI